MKQWNEKEIKLLIELRNNNFSAPQIEKIYKNRIKK